MAGDRFLAPSKIITGYSRLKYHVKTREGKKNELKRKMVVMASAPCPSGHGWSEESKFNWRYEIIHS